MIKYCSASVKSDVAISCGLQPTGDIDIHTKRLEMRKK